jgi:monothiol glutaredoxin
MHSCNQQPCRGYNKTGQQMDIIETIKEQLQSNRIMLYMKGSPNQPQCGFSARTVEALMACGERFAYVDILTNPDIRATLPGYANWPTFPQLWVDGELVGGCDIVTEMYESGELQTLIKATAVNETVG